MLGDVGAFGDMDVPQGGRGGSEAKQSKERKFHLLYCMRKMALRTDS